MNKKKANKSAVTSKSQLVAVVSDIHFDLHDVPTWRAFRQWHADVKPDKVIILGDFLDLGMMSRYASGMNDPLFAIPQIQAFVKEANELARISEVVVIEGNHDERWSKQVLGMVPHVYRGAIGLTLHDQCVAQGLNTGVKWLREDTLVRGVQCGPYLLRHGHRQAGKFNSGAKHLAANKIAKNGFNNEIFGHHHRAQIHCQSAMGKTAIAVSNPCMTKDHDYQTDPDWQRGFTILELYGPDNKYANPYLVIMNSGHFAWNGKVYDGNL